MYEKIRRHSSLASEGVGVVKSQERNMLRSSENSVLIPLMIKWKLGCWSRKQRQMN